MSARDKIGLGYGTQLNEMSNNFETDSEISLSVFDVRSSDEENIPANDRFSKADGFHVVPPPITGNFLTSRADISFAGLNEYAIRKKIIESKITDLNTKTSETVGKTNEANTQKPKTVYESGNRNKVIIEDWNPDDKDDVFEVQTVSPVKTNETQTVKTRVDKIGQTSQKQGIGFKKIKACFVCKSTDHLIKDCNFYNKQSQEPKLKIVVNTGPWVDKPIWDNTKRVNHQKISKYPLLRKTFVLSGVQTRTGLITLVKQNEKRAVHTVSTARPISTTRPVSTVRPFAPKITQTSGAIRPIYPRMDNLRPRGSYSPIKRSYYTKPAFRPKDLKQDVKTFGAQNMTTAGTRAVVNTGKDSGSFMLKKGNPEILLQDHAMMDSSCSSHMTGNKAYLSEYEENNEGFVAFRSDPKGGKITGKGKIRTANLDFDDVYFVDELKFNLFSVAQICDKKNSVLFTKTECLILSPSFKLLDESQAVLRAPRKDDVYSLNLKNTVPSGEDLVRKSDKGYLLRYSTSSKAFRVYNKRTKRVEENMHIDFLEDQPNVAVIGPNWMFDLDFLTNTMNYIPDSVENQVNVDAGTQDSYVAGSSGKDKGPTQEYILLPLQPHRTRIPVEDVAPTAHEKPSESSPKDNDVQDSEDVADKEGQHQMTEDEQVLHDELKKMIAQEVVANALDDATRQAFEEEKRNIASHKTYDDENVGTVVDFNNMDDTIIVSPIPTLRIHKNHPKDQILGDPKSAVQTRGKIQKASSAQQALEILHQQLIKKEDSKGSSGTTSLKTRPRTISQALKDESWVEAMQEELLQFKLQQVWVLVDLPFGKKAIGTKWVFRNKRDERSIVVKNVTPHQAGKREGRQECIYHTHGVFNKEY
ncbi:putative ribonuclease H-like domain-containing protein [Tanacetum coccineum]